MEWTQISALSTELIATKQCNTSFTHRTWR